MRTLFIPLLIVIYLSSCSQNEVVEPVQRTTPGAVGACSDKTPVDAMCTIAPTAVHPTQFAVGYRDVVKKRKKIHVLKEKRDEFYGYLVKKLPPVVRGPNAQWYIVDGHHTTRALAEEGVLTMYVRVRNDYAALSVDDFWRQMAKDHLVWPYDENGAGPLNPTGIPATILDLKDDVYRSLAEEVQTSGGYDATDTYFQQFLWANFLRAKIPLETVRAKYNQAVTDGVRIGKSAEAKGLPGFRTEQ